MEGVFFRKRFNIWLFLLFACGLFLIGLYIFLIIVDGEATSDLQTFLIAGIVICITAVPSWFMNLGAFIRIDKDSIQSKYHWFGKINCKITHVDFASAQGNTLIIQLKNGKRHTITGVKNTWPLCSTIRRSMDFEPTEPPESLLNKLNKLKSEKKKWLIYTCVGLAFMFINIFITVFLTGEREMHQFSATDWAIFAIMSVIEMATVIATLCFAQKPGKNSIPMEKLQYAIKRTIVETTPLLPEHVIKVFADDDYTGRITVFGCPNEESVYYTVQEFTSDYTFIRVYESEIFEDITMLPGDFEALIDITEKVLREQ